MKNYFVNCKASYLELRKTKSIVTIALLIAMSIVVSSFRIRLFPYLSIGFSTLINQYAYLLIGPTAGAVFGMVLDLLKEMIIPSGAFNLLFTIPPILAGFIYGSFYYNRKVSIVNCLAANFTVKLICNVIITTLLFVFLQGKALMVILPVRALKNLIQWPVDSILFYMLAKTMEKLKIRKS